MCTLLMCQLAHNSGHWAYFRLAPNMLKNLPIIPSRTAQNFTHYSFCIPMVPPIIPFLFFCVSDNNYYNAGVTIYYLHSR